MLELCKNCHNDVSVGSNLYINRIPADDLFLCVDCQSETCDFCNNKSHEFEITDDVEPKIICSNCMEVQ